MNNVPSVLEKLPPSVSVQKAPALPTSPDMFDDDDEDIEEEMMKLMEKHESSSAGDSLMTTSAHQRPSSGSSFKNPYLRPPTPAAAVATMPVDSNHSTMAVEIDNNTATGDMITENETRFDTTSVAASANGPIRVSTQEVGDLFEGSASNLTIVPLPLRASHGRYTWRVKVRASQNPAASLRFAIMEVWDALSTADPTLVIYPWAEEAGNDPSVALHSSNQCPFTTREMRDYFQNASARVDGNTCYVSVRMGHESSSKDLRILSAEFFDLAANRYRVGYWYRSLQHENPVEIGWLLGSTNSMSVERLKTEILHRSDGKVEVGCRHHVIALKNYDPNLPEEQRYRAIHIEVKAEQLVDATNYIADLFPSNRKSNFVLDAPMRFVPVISNQTRPTTSEACMHLRERHGGFLTQVRNARTWSIGSLDHRSKRMGKKSIRDLIMAIPLSTNPARKLFIACEAQSDGATVLSFIDSNSDEAYNRIHNLLAFLRFTNPAALHEGINNAFTASARTAAQDVIWDPTSQTVITQADRIVHEIRDDELDGFLGCDPDVQRRFILDLRGLPPPSNDEDGSSKRQVDDDDSVSTFRSGNKRAKSSDPSPTTNKHESSGRGNTSTSNCPSKQPSKRRDDMSTQSELTLESALSRVSALEDNVLAFRSEVRSDLSAIALLIRDLLPQTSLASTLHSERAGAGPPK